MAEQNERAGDVAPRLAFVEPGGQAEMTFAVLPTDALQGIKHQRKPSDPHVERVVESIRQIGFVTPVVVVPREDGDGYVIIDGQHRFLAAKKLSLGEVPAVIVPSDVARRMLRLNVEKEPNIRERAAVALSIYREMVEQEPDLPEDEPAVADAVQDAHNVTLGLAYQEYGRLAGSSFVPILKKCDGTMDRALRECLPIREARAAKVVEANSLVRAVTDKLKEIGAWHEFVGAQIISYANPVKRARKAQEFDATFDAMIAKLQELEQNPEKLARA